MKEYQVYQMQAAEETKSGESMLMFLEGFEARKIDVKQKASQYPKTTFIEIMEKQNNLYNSPWESSALQFKTRKEKQAINNQSLREMT